MIKSFTVLYNEEEDGGMTDMQYITNGVPMKKAISILTEFAFIKLEGVISQSQEIKAKPEDKTVWT